MAGVCFLATMDTAPSSASSSTRWIQEGILAYWTLFWLLNVCDKLIGGAHFMWVGRDRFAQFQKYFASVGLDAPWVADAGLVVAAALEVFALVFCAGAWLHFRKSRPAQTRSWFFVGVLLTLGTFTFFSVGDHWFGDRFELLEHTLFWFIAAVSWVVFVRLEHVALPSIPRRIPGGAVAVGAALLLATSTSIFSHNAQGFVQRTAPLEAEKVGDHLYKVSFPFLGGSTVFEETLRQFKAAHPEETIDHIYTVPKPLRLKKADALIFYISTDDKP